MTNKPNRNVIFMYGRFQGLTHGHVKVINQAMAYAAEADNTDFAIYVSKTAKNPDHIRHPLTWAQRYVLMSELWPDYVVGAELLLPAAIADMHARYPGKKTFVCGKDREKAMTGIYEIVDGKKLYIDELLIIEREDDEGSATQLREAVATNDHDKFIRLYGAPQRIAEYAWIAFCQAQLKYEAKLERDECKML